MGEKTLLHLALHGRIIDHIGIQMYQSPTAALAEAVSNAWDADATRVEITFDFESADRSEWSITVRDDGVGMTKDECQEKFLRVGFNRRKLEGVSSEKSPGGRPLMGRKGIGKFAGFGIARFIKVDTVDNQSRTRTEFELDSDEIRGGDSYVSPDGLKIDAVHSTVPVAMPHGTTITLRDMKLGRKIPVDQFIASLGKRFLMNSALDNFEIHVNGDMVPFGENGAEVELNFPKDLPDKDIVERGISIDDEGWGTELIADGREVRWRVLFFKDLLKDKELSGVTVFAHKKMAQDPFMFNLSGGVVSLAGPEYMAGKVIADWVDELEEDMISSERRRLHWDHPELSDFQDWGRILIKRLLKLWKDRRSEEKIGLLESRVEKFSQRIEDLGRKGKSARDALMKLAGVGTLSADRFREIGEAVLLACEKDRLGDLIEEISSTDEMDEAKLVEILTEAQVITTLHAAEVVYTKLQAVKGLESRVKNRELENTVRDFIAEHPWLISPRWETYGKEKQLAKLCGSAALDSFENNEDFNKRVDLVLSSGQNLLLLEFMRPGLTLDFDHLDRFRRYCYIIREDIEKNTASNFKHLTGYIIADNVAKKSGMLGQIKNMKSDDLLVMDWETFIVEAESQWKEFLDHVKLRSPDDPRLKNIGVLSEVKPAPVDD